MAFDFKILSCSHSQSARLELIDGMFKLSGIEDIGIFRYQRSTTAISIVTPICYAHLAAVSQFLKFDESLERSSSHSEGTTPAVPELPVLHKGTCSSMFF